MTARRGRFITLEGGEGAGKTTQLAALADSLRQYGLTVLLTREPGGSRGAEQIRQLLVQGETDRWNRQSETLLLYAARCDHWHKTILPALERGEWVLCDRFNDSTLAYQGGGHGVPVEELNGLFHFATGGQSPDLTLILDLPVEDGLRRAGQRSSRIWTSQSPDQDTGDREDRFERIGLDFHQRVRKAFGELSRREPQRCCLIDASQSLESVHAAIWTEVKQRLLAGGKGQGLDG